MPPFVNLPICKSAQRSFLESQCHPMAPEQSQLLSLNLLPARLDMHQAAHFLGFGSHDIQTLVAAGLLMPLGRPAHNSTKYFATVQLELVRQDIKWLIRATEAVQKRWRCKNHTEAPLLRSAQHTRRHQRRLAKANNPIAVANDDGPSGHEFPP